MKNLKGVFEHNCAIRKEICTVEFEESKDGKRKIYCTYGDTEVASLWVNVTCPYCENEQQELDLTECGATYKIHCEECEKEFEMYFDAS